jgi:hypothetical protein
VNDSQISDLLRTLGVGFLVTDWLGNLVGRSDLAWLAAVALSLLLASFLFDAARWDRRRVALKRFKRKVRDAAAMPQKIVHLGGDS